VNAIECLQINLLFVVIYQEPPCGGLPWVIRQNWTLTDISDNYFTVL